MLGTLAALPALLGKVRLGAFARAGLKASTGAAPPIAGRGFTTKALAGAHNGTLVAKIASGEPAPPG
jgi:hypothetical protein